MKRILTLLLAAGMVLGVYAQASALEIEAKGQFAFAFGLHSNSSFTDQEDDSFFARQRIRLQADFIASENLRGVLQFQIGTKEWGNTDNNSADNAQLDGNQTDIRTRRAYIQWDVPSTHLQFTMGLSRLALPSFTFGNPVMDSDVYGVIAAYDFTDDISLTGFWARPFYDRGDLGGSKDYKNNSMDMFGLVLNMDFQSWKLAPWLLYSRVGDNSGYFDYMAENRGSLVEKPTKRWGGNDDSDMYIGGLAFKYNDLFTQGLSFAFDGMYGVLNSGNDDSFETRGWLVAARLDYETQYGTPGLFGWYASGDDSDDLSDDNKGGRLPVVGLDNGFVPTRLGFGGSVSMGDDTYISKSGVGTWGVGAQMADISFIEKLSHTVRVAYYRGTNDGDAAKYLPGFLGETVYMTKDDSAIEVNLDSTYQIYENLSATLELGYIHLDIDNQNGYKRSDVYNEDNAWNAQLILMYEF